ncbi:MAG: hypothetical protein C0391_07815 [Anaerolinea sp.]|nr:hypothetical protein [Anaerolinea sp.]
MITGEWLIKVFGINLEQSHLSLEVHGGSVWDSGEADSGFVHRSSAGVLYPSVQAGILIGLAIWLLGIEPQ